MMSVLPVDIQTPTTAYVVFLLCTMQNLASIIKYVGGVEHKHYYVSEVMYSFKNYGANTNCKDQQSELMPPRVAKNQLSIMSECSLVPRPLPP